MSFFDARARHARYRALAYTVTAETAVQNGWSSPGILLTDIDDWTLDVWRRSWTVRHPHGDWPWDWDDIMRGLPNRAAVFPAAVWHGDTLCGLVRGYLTKHRPIFGGRHAVALEFIEACPRSHPLRRRVVEILCDAAENYGATLGARYLRLMNPKSDVLKYYMRPEFRFEVAYKGSKPHYCEREINR